MEEQRLQPVRQRPHLNTQESSRPEGQRVSTFWYYVLYIGVGFNENGPGGKNLMGIHLHFRIIIS